LAAGLVVGVPAAGAASPITLEIPATANIFRAGYHPPPHTPYPAGGGLPPALFSFQPGQIGSVAFTHVEGSVDFGNPTTPTGPDGGNFSYGTDSFNGIAGITAPSVGFLAGVFLDSKEPTNPPPAKLDFTVIGTEFVALAPETGQVFFIGDGRTSSGATQTFLVPPTATRLYLGLADSQYPGGPPGYYHDNTGSFTANLEVQPLSPASRVATTQSTMPSQSGTPLDHEASTLTTPINGRTNVTTAPVYRASPTILPLPSDRAFGYALPADVSLSHRIEASTDLVHWTSIWDAPLYFKDPDSTNFDQRFYRFTK